LKLGSTPFWLSASLMLGLSMHTAYAGRESNGKPPQRHNELTLAGIRPGRDSMVGVIARYKQPTHLDDSSPSWLGACGKEQLSVDIDSQKQVQALRVMSVSKTPISTTSTRCNSSLLVAWRTGRGLQTADACSRTVALYGNPDSRSPSTKDAQPLELLYYAFDWAGPDVPQVMQVVCTAEKDGQAGRVVQITLAASSL
jgi:hypothetical protein